MLERGLSCRRVQDGLSGRKYDTTGGKQMIVVKAKNRDVYMGKYLKAGVRVATDIKHAQRYKSVATAKAALRAMGYDDVEGYDYDFVEVEE